MHSNRSLPLLRLAKARLLKLIFSILKFDKYSQQEKLQNSMKDEINASANNALIGGIMDDTIYDAHIIEAFGSQLEDSIECYLDLPIGDLIALKPRDFYSPGSSWRTAAKNLHCQGWDSVRDDIVRYFTSDLFDKSFPAPGSSLELRIGFTGGAIYCRLGNHRAVAAKAWLAGNHDEKAVFKKVKCYYQNIYPPLKQLINKCKKEGSTLKYAFASSECTYFRKNDIADVIMVERSPSSFDIYNLNTRRHTMKIVKPSKSRICRLLRFDLRSRCSCLNFQKVPTKLIEFMLDESKVELFQSHTKEKK